MQSVPKIPFNAYPPPLSLKDGVLAYDLRGRPLFLTLTATVKGSETATVVVLVDLGRRWARFTWKEGF